MAAGPVSIHFVCSETRRPAGNCFATPVLVGRDTTAAIVVNEMRETAVQEWTFVGTFPPLNTFPTGPRPVFFSLVVVALFPAVLSVFCFRRCPFARLFLLVLVRSFLGCGCRSISSYCPVVDLSVFFFCSCPFALVIFCFWIVSVHVEKCWLKKN